MNVNVMVDECIEAFFKKNSTVYNGSENLISAGLDSIAIVNLILELEAFFNISIPDDKLDLSAFSKPDSIKEIIENLV